MGVTVCASCGKQLPVIPHYKRKTALCVSCNAKRSAAFARGSRKPPCTSEERRDKKRRYYLPDQIMAARRKLEILLKEAERLGVEI